MVSVKTIICQKKKKEGRKFNFSPLRAVVHSQFRFKTKQFMILTFHNKHCRLRKYFPSILYEKLIIPKSLIILKYICGKNDGK